MKKTALSIAVIAILFLSAFTGYQSVRWNIAKNYSVKFTTHKVSGIFRSFKGDIHFDSHDLTGSRFDVMVDVKSVSTGNGLKNRHAKSKKWLNAKEYPTIKFTSAKILKTNQGFQTIGKLTMRGVQKQISIPFTFQNNIFKGSFEVNRLSYNIGTTKGMASKVGKTLKIDLAIPVIK